MDVHADRIVYEDVSHLFMSVFGQRKFIETKISVHIYPRHATKHNIDNRHSKKISQMFIEFRVLYGIFNAIHLSICTKGY